LSPVRQEGNQPFDDEDGNLECSEFANKDQMVNHIKSTAVINEDTSDIIIIFKHGMDAMSEID